ncbi:MAG: cation:dicarboxylase symporter family transporter [Saprospiraceae bacterium]|nr:cation:dicarboxylase symporter family transporter [Saprospiraceae bacterium]
MKKIFRNLTLWVLIAIFGGVLLGIYDPATAMKMDVLGKGFIQVVKIFINPIIFLTITLGISGMGDLRKVGQTGGKALIYFEVVTTFALIIGVLVSYMVQPGAGVDTARAAGADMSGYVQKAAQFSWVAFFAQNTTLQILGISLVLGILLSVVSWKLRVIQPLERISHYVFKVLHWVMYLSPIGAFGGMAYTVGKFGVVSLFALAKLMVSVYITMALFVFVVLGLILRHYNIPIGRFLQYIRDELLIVLGTSSSEAALPSLMEKLERMGCNRSVVGLVVPAGYSFNLDGTTLYLSMAVIFLAQAYQVHLTWDQVLAICGVLMITSKGAAGVTGSGFIVLASTLQTVHVIPIEGLALLLGVDRFMSEARAITNLIGNGVATIWLSNNEGMFDRDQMEAAFKVEINEEFYL